MTTDPRPVDPMKPTASARPHGPRRPVLTAAGFDVACDEIVELVEGLRGEYAVLQARAGEERRARSVYPRSALDGGGSPTNIVEEELDPESGETIQVTVPQHSDPVGELVASQDEEPGPAAAALVGMVELVHGARRTLEQATSKAAASQPLRPGTDEPLSRDWCWNCAQARVMTPTYRDSGDPDRGLPPEPRCRACYDWWRAHRGEPGWPSEMPVELVKDRAANVRLTTKRVDEVVAAWRQRQGGVGRRRPKRRRAS